MALGSLQNIDGGWLKQLLRHRLQNEATEPATAGFNAGNEGAVIFDTTTKRAKVLYDTGGAVMAWDSLATASDVAAGFSGIVVDNTGAQVTLTGNGVAGTELVGNITDGSVLPADLDANFGLDDLPGTPVGAVGLGNQQINNLADGVANTDAVTVQQLNAAVAANSITGQFVGSENTVALLTTNFPPANNNGDWAILSADDGGNQSGIYVSNGAAWVLAKEIPEPLAVGNASEVVAGIIEIATQAETDAGTLDTHAVTPLKLDTSIGVAGRTVQRNETNLTGAAANTNSVITHNLASTELVSVRGRQLVAQPFGAGAGLPGNWGAIGQEHDFTDMVVAKAANTVTLAIEDLVPVDNAFAIVTYARA